MALDNATSDESFCDAAASALQRGDYEETLTAASEALLRRDDEHLGYYLRSNALLGLGRHREALADAERAVALVNGQVGRWTLYGWLAHVHMASGDVASAEEAFRRGLLELGDQADLHAALARFMTAVGTFEPSQIRFHEQRAAMLDPVSYAPPPPLPAVPPCPVCGGLRIRSIPAVMADFVRNRCEVPFDEEVRSNFCESCEHVFLTPFLSSSQLARLYRDYRGPSYNRDRLAIEPSYASYAAEFAEPRSQYVITREKFYGQYLADFRNVDGLVVDFGGDTGYFARYVFPKAEVVVVEEGFAREGGDLPALMRRADVLFCAHVFEHIPFPFAVLNDLTHHMRTGSRTVVELPLEYSGFLVSVFQGLEQRCAAGDCSPVMSLQVLHEHLAHFSTRSAETLMDRCGVTLSASHVGDMGIMAFVGSKR